MSNAISYLIVIILGILVGLFFGYILGFDNGKNKIENENKDKMTNERAVEILRRGLSFCFTEKEIADYFRACELGMDALIDKIKEEDDNERIN